MLPSKENKEIFSKDHLEKLYVFVIMWSFGAFLELDDRKKLEEYLRSNGEFKLNLPLSEATAEDSIFDYYVDEKGEWSHWNSRVEEYIYPTDHSPEYGSILVPNVDNVRTDFLIKTIAKQNKAVLLIGEQGTAKTVIIKGFMDKYNPEEHAQKTLNFSSATTPNMFQVNIIFVLRIQMINF
jgi:dynein heavy chain